MKSKTIKIICIGLLVLLSSCAQNTRTIEEFSGKSSEYYYNLGMASLAAGNYAKAIAEFKKAIIEYPQNYKAYESLGIAYANVGDYKKALKYINKSLEIKPDYYEALLEKATVLEISGNIEKAIKTLNTCINNDLCILRPEAYYQLANIYKKQNDTKDYIQNLNMAILYDRNFKVAKLDLAKAYIANNMCADKNIEQKVIALLEDQLDKNEALILKAKCYIEAKDFQKAKNIVKYILTNTNIKDIYKRKAIELSKLIVEKQYISNKSSEPKNHILFANTSPRTAEKPATEKEPIKKTLPKAQKEANTSKPHQTHIPKEQNYNIKILIYEKY